MRIRRNITVLLVTTTFAAPSGALAQSFLWKLDGDASNTAAFGETLTSVGDVDDDGFEDFVVTDPYITQTGYGHLGEFFLYSGATRSLLWSELGTHGDAYLGEQIAPLGDLDGDGYREFAIGCEASLIYVESPRKQTLLYSLSGGGGGGIRYGTAGSRDLNADGVPDVLVGGFNQKVLAYSGKDGSQLFVISSFRGQSVADAGDVDGDGVTDVIASDPYVSHTVYVNVGEVRVFSGADQHEIWRIDGDGLGSDVFFGDTVRGGHDLDADGVPDFLVQTSRNSGIQSYVYAYSGATGQLLTQWPSNSGISNAELDFSSDFDRDGVTDVVLMRDSDTHVISGRTWSDIFSLPGVAGALTTADVDGDGIQDLLVGVHQAGVGSVVAYSGAVPPTVSSVAPARFSHRDQKSIAVFGTNLSKGVGQQILVGTQSANNVTIVDDTELTGTVASGDPGVFDVTVQNSIGGATLPQAVIRTPAIELLGDPHLGSQVSVRYLIDPYDGIFAIAGLPPPVSIPTPPFDGALEIVPFTSLFLIPPGTWPQDEFDLSGDIPNDPGLLGVQVLFQALVGPAFAGPARQATWTNLVTLTIQ